jgi:hypothetical protein
LSGNVAPYRILLFNWATMTYSVQVATLNGDHRNGDCAILKGTNGVTLVAIAGGYSAGIDVWNPASGSVTTLNSTFPLVDYGTNPKMIAVNGNTELIFYESSNSPGNPKGIWKFNLASNTWTKIGEMVEKRITFAALAVEGISC